MSAEYPTPEYDRAGAVYECSSCGDAVNPKCDDLEAGVVIAGRTEKLCEDCAREALEAVANG